MVTGTTTVTHESAWNDYTRSRVMALMAYESQLCPDCGNYQVLVELPKDLRHVTWAEFDDRKFEVGQYRCLACASADVIKRGWAERHKDDKPPIGQAGAADGRKFMARPVDVEED